MSAQETSVAEETAIETAIALPTTAPDVDATQATEKGGGTVVDMPAEMPVTGAGNGSRGLAIMLTVAAVLALLIGFSLWEKRSVGQ